MKFVQTQFNDDQWINFFLNTFVVLNPGANPKAVEGKFASVFNKEAAKQLQNFAYRINIDWWIFLIAGGSAVFIALLTVSFQAIKAAIANPVKSLRTE